MKRGYRGSPSERGSVWDRLLDLSVLDPVTDCWIWIGAVIYNRRGDRYPVIKVNGKQKLAHRESWKCVHGREMPKRKHGAHSCDNTICINPDHVRGASPSANQREAYRKGRKQAPGKALGKAMRQSHAANCPTCARDAVRMQFI